MEKNPSEITIHQAAKWYARLQAPDCGNAERVEFQHWLELDPCHAQAYESVSAAASLISDKWASDPRMAALAAEALGDPADRKKLSNAESSRSGRSFNYVRHLAAAVCCIGIGLFFTTYHNHRAVDEVRTEVYVNHEITRKRVDLIDGSVVHLDVGAKMNVTMTSSERRLELKTGRALFDVAHDKTRPFSVSALGSEVVALGTRFQVELKEQEHAVNVILAEGSVAVSDIGGADAWREVLVPGQELKINAQSNSPQKINVNVDALTSWSKGVLVFDGMPLGNVLEELNRYSQTRVVLGDNTLARIPIAGHFLAGGDSSEFVETLTDILPLRSVRTGANEIVLFQTHETPKH